MANRAREVLGGMVAIARREQVVLTAGSIAYFTFISLVPLLLLLVTVLSTFRSHALTAWILTRATRALAPRSATVLQEIVFDAATGQPVTVASGVVLLWGALLTFRALNSAFGGIYDTYRESSLLGTAADVLLVLVVVVVSVVALTVAGELLSAFVTADFWDALWPLLLFGVLATVFFPLYYVLPDVDVTVREALPGAVSAAAAWSVLRVLFGYYASVSSTAEFYGAAGTFLLILVWLYVGGFVLLGGAILNATLAGHADPDAKWALDAL